MTDDLYPHEVAISLLKKHIWYLLPSFLVACGTIITWESMFHPRMFEFPFAEKIFGIYVLCWGYICIPKKENEDD